MSGPRLVVGFDAVEVSLVRELLTAGRLPALAGIVATGSLRDVRSPADLGSGAVWPTFMTGAPPSQHGFYFHPHVWSPSAMRLCDAAIDLVPWWWRLAERGERVLAVDVPLAPLGTLPGLVDVSEWGAHDVVRGRIATHPTDLAAELHARFGRHPFDGEPRPHHHNPPAAYGTRALVRATGGIRARGELGRWLIERERPDLAVIAFPEWHHAAHLLWPATGEASSPVAQLASELDAALARLLGAADWGSVAVVALHGMRRANGLVQALGPVLEALGYATRRRSSPHRRFVGAAKARTPERVRQVWRRRVPPKAARRVAAATMLGDFDWGLTRAFALPSDQHGWLRVNLAGREARGIVPAVDYDALCDELAGTLGALVADDGRPVVDAVLRTGGTGEPLSWLLPDLVVHWSEATMADPLLIAEPEVRSRPDARRLTGQHAVGGFLASSGIALPDGELDVAGLAGLLAS